MCRGKTAPPPNRHEPSTDNGSRVIKLGLGNLGSWVNSTSAPTASAFIAQMSRKARGRCHPLKHLVMITWLFGRLNIFIDAYDRRSAAGLLIKNSNAKVVGGAQLHIADEPSNAVTRKPKKLNPPLRAAILENLKKDKPKIKFALNSRFPLAPLIDCYSQTQ